MSYETTEIQNLTASINVIGRQRMLAHKIIMCLSFRHIGSAERAHAQLMDACDRFREGHQIFTDALSRLQHLGRTPSGIETNIDAFARWVDRLDQVTPTDAEIEHQCFDVLPKFTAGVNATLAAIESVAQDAEDARRKTDADNQSFVAAVAQDLQDIGRKIGFIALNARIEAARHNSHGGSFAVIASEITALSTLSREKADMIAQRLNTPGG